MEEHGLANEENLHWMYVCVKPLGLMSIDVREPF